MKSKKLVVIICMLVTASVFPIVTSSAASDGNIIYVDDDGGADYTNIQDAIDAASNGDTIFVYNGIYTEHILIDKTITLMGEDKNTTIINSRLQKDIVQVFDTDNVTISGFLIQNTLGYSEYMAAVHIKNTSNTMILQNILTGCYDGILLKSSYNNIISNSIRDNKNGICFGHYRDGRVFIKGNNGDVAYGFSHIKNSITGNEITKNTEAGLALSFTMGNNISANNISNNGIGIRLRDCSNNIVQYNNFIDNMLNAFDMLQNQWDMNYWDNWIGLKISILDFLPYYISGTLFANLDFHPAQEPYVIGGE
jgi:parallel beta-helix repeat protein